MRGSRAWPRAWRYNASAPARLRAALEGDFRSALQRHGDSDGLSLALQPKGRLKDGHVVGAEALIRWHHPQRGVLPPAIEADIIHKLYYGHFFCHVFHQDYVIRKGGDPLAIEHAMWAVLDGRGAEYPAEHNVGHLYPAKEALAAHYRALDPCNAFNPGVGQTSKCAHWAPKKWPTLH